MGGLICSGWKRQEHSLHALSLYLIRSYLKPRQSSLMSMEASDSPAASRCEFEPQEQCSICHRGSLTTNATSPSGTTGPTSTVRSDQSTIGTFTKAPDTEQ